MTEFTRYVELATAGATRVEVYRAGRAAGLGEIDAIRMLRYVFGMSLKEAKETSIMASGSAGSLKEHEEEIARQLSELESD